VTAANSFDLLVIASTLEDVRNSLQCPDVPIACLPSAASRIRQERDDLREALDEIRLLLDMPGAPLSQVVRALERVRG